MGDHIYDELADRYAASSATGAPNALYDRPTVLALLGPLAGRRVVELGCAAGHLTQQLVDAGADVVALDRSARMVEHARARVGHRARVERATSPSHSRCSTTRARTSSSPPSCCTTCPTGTA